MRILWVFLSAAYADYYEVLPRHLWRAQMKIQEPLGNQTPMKSNAQLRHEGQDEAHQPPPIHVEMPTVASSSQTARPPPQSNAVLTKILASLESLHGGRSSMRWVVHSINLHGAVPAGYPGVSLAPSSGS